MTKPIDGDGYDGRSASIGSAPDPDHRQLQAYLAANKIAMWSSSGGWSTGNGASSAGPKRTVSLSTTPSIATSSSVPGLLDPYRLVLSVGHDEYWSWGMRDAIDAFVGARRQPRDLLRQHRLLAGALRGRRPDDDLPQDTARRTDPVRGTDRQHLLTSIWSDPLIGRPENRTTGLSFCRGGYVRFGRGVPRSSGAYTVCRPDHWVFAGTGLRYGDALGLGSHIVAYEIDGCEFTMEDGAAGGHRPRRNSGRLHHPRDGPAHLLSNTPDNNEAIIPLSFDTSAVGDLEYTAEILLGRRLAREHQASRLRPCGHGPLPAWRRGVQCRHDRLVLRPRP